MTPMHARRFASLPGQPRLEGGTDRLDLQTACDSATGVLTVDYSCFGMADGRLLQIYNLPTGRRASAGAIGESGLSGVIVVPAGLTDEKNAHWATRAIIRRKGPILPGKRESVEPMAARAWHPAPGRLGARGGCRALCGPCRGCAGAGGCTPAALLGPSSWASSCSSTAFGIQYGRRKAAMAAIRLGW